MYYLMSALHRSRYYITTVNIQHLVNTGSQYNNIIIQATDHVPKPIHTCLFQLHRIYQKSEWYPFVLLLFC